MRQHTDWDKHRPNKLKNYIKDKKIMNWCQHIKKSGVYKEISDYYV